VIPSCVLLRAKQHLSETFLFTGFSFRDIGLDHLKWDTLYIKKSRTLKILKNKHFQKKVSYKSCKILSDALRSNVSVILDSVVKIT